MRARAALFTVLSLSAALSDSKAVADVMISNNATQNMACSSGICAPTAANAVLNVTDLKILVDSGDVTVTTTGAGVQANEIVIAAPLGWASAATLSLDAFTSIAIEKLLYAKGRGGLTLTTNDGGAGGVLSFAGKGRARFAKLSSRVVINHTFYKLVNNFRSLIKAVRGNPAGFYGLADTIDASAKLYGGAPPMKMLAGTVEGLGNTISRFTIRCAHSNCHPALFYQVAASGAVSNLRLAEENVVVSHNRSVAAGLAYTNYGVLSGDSIEGTFDASRCEVECAASGMVVNNDGSIIHSSSDVTITAAEGAGLVFENNSAGTIEMSHANGTIAASGGAGGLVYLNYGKIDESYADTVVGTGSTGTSGGLVGNDDEGYGITDSYAVGSVAGGGNEARIGGLVGSAGPNTKTSYSASAVSGGANSWVGGFLGFAPYSDSFSDCYWDTTASGTEQGDGNGEVSGLTGLTTQQLTAALPAGFDPAIWTEASNINNGLPYLINNPPPK